MNANLLGLIKCSSGQIDSWYEGLDLGGSIIPALLGAAGGGAAGYLTGRDEDANGEGGTRKRNALIGALLGGSITGAGYYGLLRNWLIEEHKADERQDRYYKAREHTKQASTADFIENVVSAGPSTSVRIAYHPFISIPALLGLIGGGTAGYIRTKDKKNKLRNALLSAITGATAGALGGGAAQIIQMTEGEKERYSDY